MNEQRTKMRQSRKPCLLVHSPATALGSLSSVALSSARAIHATTTASINQLRQITHVT